MNTNKHSPKVKNIEALSRIGVSSRAMEQHRFCGDVEIKREELCLDLLTNSKISRYGARKILSYQPLYLSEYRDLLKAALQGSLRNDNLIPLWQEYHELLYVVHSAFGYELQEISLLRQMVEHKCVFHTVCSNFSSKALSILNEFVSENMVFERYPIQNHLILRYDSENPSYIIINKEHPMEGIFGGAEWKT